MNGPKGEKKFLCGMINLLITCANVALPMNMKSFISFSINETSQVLVSHNILKPIEKFVLKKYIIEGEI